VLRTTLLFLGIFLGALTILWPEENPTLKSSQTEPFIWASDEPQTLQHDKDSADELEMDKEEPGVDLPEIILRTLCHNRDIYNLYQDIQESLGKWQQTYGLYDMRLTSLYAKERLSKPILNFLFSPPFDNGFQRQYIDDIHFNAETRLRSGTLLRSTVDIRRLRDNLQLPYTQTDSALRFRIEVPLMRNSGYVNYGAQEIAAGYDYWASYYAARFQISQIMATVAQAYWRYIILNELMEVFRQAWMRNEKFLEDVQTMVDAGEVAETELYQILANVKNRKEQFIRTQQDVFAAKQALLLLMALDPLLERHLPIIIDKFPYPPVGVLESINEVLENTWALYALDMRDDYLATLELIQSARALLQKTYNALEPELNVGVEVGFNGKQPGRGFNPYPESLYKRVNGLNTRGEIALSMPLCYYEEMGAYRSQLAITRKREMDECILHDRILSDVIRSAEDVKHNALQRQAFLVAVKASREAVEQELFKFQHGQSNVFTIIQLDDRYVQDEVASTNQAFDYINSIITLRFNMGIILPKDDEECITPELLIGLPYICESQSEGQESCSTN
jgi:outer membrane protein TolC